MPKRCFLLCLSIVTSFSAEVTRSVPVSSALLSDLSLDLGGIAGGMERTLHFSHAKYSQIQDLAKDCLRRYLGSVVVAQRRPTAIEASPLSLEKQAELEQYFDAGLLKLCDQDQAEKVKYLFIRFFYFQTGAFGKHPLHMEVRDGAFYVSAGPLKEVKVALADGDFLFTHPLLSNLLAAHPLAK